MITDGNLGQLRDHALKEVERAERVYWEYFVEFVKTDIGPELSQWLDTTFGGCGPGSISKRVLPWRLDTAFVTVVLRLPGCTEIALQYCRARAAHQARTVEDYTDLEWVSLPWNLNPGTAQMTMGKYAAVRYMLAKNPPEEAKVAPHSSVTWYVNNNLEMVKIAAAEFAREKEQLEEEAKQIVRSAFESVRSVAAKRL
jgi:hypothetical protein